MFTGGTLVALDAATAKVRLLLCRQHETERQRPRVSESPSAFLPGVRRYLPSMTRQLTARHFRTSFMLDDADTKQALRGAEFRWFRVSVYLRRSIEPMEEEDLRLVLSCFVLFAVADGPTYGVEFINSNRRIHELYLTGPGIEGPGPRELEPFSDAAITTFAERVLLPRLVESYQHQPLRTSVPPFAVACTVADDSHSRVMILGLPPAAPPY